MKKILTIKPLRIFEDKEGKLFETLRADDDIFGGKFGQNLVSFVKPGVVKGFHLHHKQTEYTTCIKGDILYVAIRKVAKKKLEMERIFIGERNPKLIRTDPGIWHGYTPLNREGAIVLYTMDKPYNPKDTDTEDKSPYAFGGKIWDRFNLK